MTAHQNPPGEPVDAPLSDVDESAGPSYPRKDRPTAAPAAAVPAQAPPGPCNPKVYRDGNRLRAACMGCGWRDADTYPQDFLGFLTGRMVAQVHGFAAELLRGAN